MLTALVSPDHTHNLPFVLRLHCTISSVTLNFFAILGDKVYGAFDYLPRAFLKTPIISLSASSHQLCWRTMWIWRDYADRYIHNYLWPSLPVILFLGVFFPSHPSSHFKFSIYPIVAQKTRKCKYWYDNTHGLDAWHFCDIFYLKPVKYRLVKCVLTTLKNDIVKLGKEMSSRCQWVDREASRLQIH